MNRAEANADYSTGEALVLRSALERVFKGCETCSRIPMVRPNDWDSYDHYNHGMLEGYKQVATELDEIMDFMSRNPRTEAIWARIRVLYDRLTFVAPVTPSESMPNL